MNDKANWYDGNFYGRLIDPIAGAAFAPPVLSRVESGASVIDIGCGTGALCEKLAQRCSRVVGIDLSSKMIGYAERRRGRNPSLPLEFIHADAASLAEHVKPPFDYAVMCMFIHEVDEKTRAAVMAEAGKVARSFIIVDYTAPGPGRTAPLNHLINRAIEFGAGREHYRNYRDWISRGGLDGFAERQGLAAAGGEVMKPGTVKIIRAYPAAPRN